MDSMKFVDFEKFCPACKYADLDEILDPCNQCLDCGARENTARPLYFEEGKHNGRTVNRNRERMHKLPESGTGDN